MKPCRGVLFPANYVETSKTMKHLVRFLPHFNFSQYCDRRKHCPFPRVVAVKRSKTKGQRRANRWIYNFLFIYPFCIVCLETLPSGQCFQPAILTPLGLNTFFLIPPKLSALLLPLSLLSPHAFIFFPWDAPTAWNTHLQISNANSDEKGNHESSR